MNRRHFLVLPALPALAPAWAHHGWSSFDTSRPLYLQGVARQVAWRNPHAELDLQLPEQPRLPDDLATRALPAQSAPVDGAALLRAASLPRRADKLWHIELAPLSRLQAWKVPEIKPGDALAVLGFSMPGETGAALLRAEYLFLAGQVYGLRSAPA